jgi:hypothetical protein
MASSTNLRMVVIGQTRPLDLPPYSTVYWHYKQWRQQGVVEELMRVLHFQVRAQVKKNRSRLH